MFFKGDRYIRPKPEDPITIIWFYIYSVLWIRSTVPTRFKVTILWATKNSGSIMVPDKLHASSRDWSTEIEIVLLSDHWSTSKPPRLDATKKVSHSKDLLFRRRLFRSSQYLKFGKFHHPMLSVVYLIPFWKRWCSTKKSNKTSHFRNLTSHTYSCLCFVI